MKTTGSLALDLQETAAIEEEIPSIVGLEGLRYFSPNKSPEQAASDKQSTDVLGTSDSEEKPVIPSISAIPRTPTQPKPRSISLQKWEGVVTNISEGLFTARLVDLTQTGPEEEAEFSISEISQGDQNLMEQGAVFYWSIGYLDDLGGQRTRTSLIRFRRLPVWSEGEIEKAREDAESIGRLIGWH